MKIIIRRATKEDAIGIFKLCVGMHNETVYSRYRFNPEKVITRILHWIDTTMTLIAVRTREDSTEDVIGFMVASRRELWFSDDVVAGEDILYVRPDERGTRAALLLGRGFVEWGRAEGDIVDLRAGVTTGEKGAGGERLYEHLGMKNMGANFMLPLERN